MSKRTFQDGEGEELEGKEASRGAHALHEEQYHGVVRKTNIPLECINRCVAYRRDEVMQGLGWCLAGAPWPYLGTPLGRQPGHYTPPTISPAKVSAGRGANEGAVRPGERCR